MVSNCEAERTAERSTLVTAVRSSFESTNGAAELPADWTPEPSTQRYAQLAALVKPELTT